MAKSKNVTPTGRPARKLFITAKDHPESQKGLMFEGVLNALYHYGARNKSEIQWGMWVGYAKEEYKNIPRIFVTVTKRKARMLGSKKYKNLYNIVDLSPRFFDPTTASNSNIPLEYDGRAMGPSFESLRKAVQHAETYLMLPQDKYTYNIRYTDIPEDI